MTTSHLLGSLFLVIGGGALLVGRLAATANLKRNGLVGMRTSATLASDAAWVAAHRASAWSFAVIGVLFLALGGWHLVARPAERVASAVTLAITLVVGVVAVGGGIQADRVAKRTVEETR